ncbi:MAG: cyclic nucleotide-binding domain-containing protein [Spirochaetaceae bacterium]|jgi:CRP-like cAMP-binding protein|nr:cyclic nucleotide-binding domain-containing protein [Spirochaetaceae bacterium]
MPDQLQLIFVTFKKDSYIVVEGKQNADRFYIIRQGKVRISKDVEVVEEEDGNILGPGDFFGVVSTMSSHSHIETARALADVTLISVQREQYGQLIQNNTPVAMKIIRQFSRRMRYLDEAFTRLTLKNTAQNDTSHLFKVAEYYLRQSQYNQAYYAYHQYMKHCPRGPEIKTTRERMMKIAPYVKNTKFDYAPGEFNRQYPRDSMLFSEGEPGDELYIIREGSVKIVKIVDNNEVLLAVLKPGDIFGEMALLESKPRAACAIAYDDCAVLAVNRDNFERMVGTQPQIVSRLTTLLAERIWYIYKQLANTLKSDPLGRMYDALLIQLEKNRVNLKVAQSYTFDFGPRELINIVGLPKGDGTLVLRKMLEDRCIQVINDRITVTNIWDIVRQTEYYKKMQRIERSRHAASLPFGGI